MGSNSDQIIAVKNKLILEKLSEGLSVQSIAQILNVSRTTVYKIKNGLHNKKRGPKKQIPVANMTNQIKSSVTRMRKYGKRVSARNVMTDIQTNYSLRSVQRFLKESPSFKYGNIKRKIVLTERQKKNRLRIIKK